MNNQSTFSEVIISALIAIFSGVTIQHAIDNAISEEFTFLRAHDFPNTLPCVEQQLGIEKASVDLAPVNANPIQT